MTPRCFYWNSVLTEERKQEICDWFNALPEAQQKFVEEMRADARAETQFECDEAASE